MNYARRARLGEQKGKNREGGVFCPPRAVSRSDAVIRKPTRTVFFLQGLLNHWFLTLSHTLLIPPSPAGLVGPRSVPDFPLFPGCAGIPLAFSPPPLRRFLSSRSDPEKSGGVFALEQIETSEFKVTNVTRPTHNFELFSKAIFGLFSTVGNAGVFPEKSGGQNAFCCVSAGYLHK